MAIEGDKMVVDIEVPHNTTAHVILPGADPEAIDGDGISFTACCGGSEAEIGSGVYRFVYPYKE